MDRPQVVDRGCAYGVVATVFVPRYRQIVTPSTVGPQVVLRPSTRRKRTVSAYREGDQVVVLVPARMSRAEQERWATQMVARITASEGRSPGGDQDLLELAVTLAKRYLPELNLEKFPGLSVRWSSRQRQRWGSCSPLEAKIRVSDRLRGVPGWVLDTVVLHELAHLVEPNHSRRFHELVARDPRTPEAAVWLEGYGRGLARSVGGSISG